MGKKSRTQRNWLSAILKYIDIEYLGEIIVFVSALVAIKGGTWKDNKSGFRKITITGYLTIIFAIIGLAISIVTTRQSAIESKKNKDVANRIESNTEITKQQLQATKIQLLKANSQIDTLSQKLSTANFLLREYKEIVNQIKVRTDRIPQEVMMEFVDLNPGQHWDSPSKVYSGSIIEFYGFDDGLYLYYGNRHERITAWDGHAVQTAVIGESGKGFDLTLSNQGNKRIMGKVHVLSSPRIRSTDWSWIDEKINKASVKK
jgi:hypothetical protein